MMTRASFRSGAASFAAALALLLAAAPLGAQQGEPVYQTALDMEPEPVNPPRSPFNLKGLGDFAISGMKPAGSNRWFVTNTGPGDTFGFFSALPGGVRGTVWSGSNYNSQFFEIQFWGGAPASEWRRNRDLAPSLEKIKNAEGLNPGYTTRLNLQRWAPDYQWQFQGRDGTLGKLHSGASVTGDGSCRDHTISAFGAVNSGVPLLASSDCPETWGSLGWQGERPIPTDSWIQLAQERGSEFAFDWWRVPEELKNQSKFLGDYQAFGESSDYGLEARSQYGEVVPGGSGAPTLEGYPLGLDIRFDAYVFHLSEVANIYFYQMLLINNSEQLYGVPLDYDSLYYGTLLRPFHTNQVPTAYSDPERGLVASNVVGGHPACNGARRVGDIRGCNQSRPRGFEAGASGVIVLKSPIGDLRNKLFTRGDAQTNPFYNPDHPNRGDTITFNQNNLCGFTCTQAQHIQGAGASYQAARSFGTLANREALSLNDRLPTDLTERQYFDLFHNEDWPVRWSPSTGLAGGYNRYVPGVHDDKPVWRYSNRPAGATDPGPDTLWLGACGSRGCVDVWADTLPGGFPMNLHNTTYVGAGPFPLAAGDTTSYLFAYWSAPDSAQSELFIEKAIDFYMNFFLGPEAPAVPRIVATNVTGGARGAGDTRVSLYFDESAVNWVDPFLDAFADKMEAAVAPDPLARLRSLNPWLPDSIRIRARDNIKQIYVFKSCNAGATWTASSQCTRDEARDLNETAIGPGWQSYARLSPTARSFSDASVTAGQTYLYSLLAESRGVSFIIVDSLDFDGDGVFEGLGASNYQVAPSILTTLTASTGAPNVASVYVPASTTAGGQRAEVLLRDGLPHDLETLQFSIVGAISDTLRYSVFYADSVVVTEYAGAPGVVDSTRIETFTVVDTASTGSSARRTPVGAAGSFLSRDPLGLEVAGGTSSTQGDVTTTTLATGTGASLSMIVVDRATGTPIFVVGGSGTTTLATPSGALARPDAAPVLISTSRSLGGTLDAVQWFDTEGALLRSNATPSVTWVASGSGRSIASGEMYGPYEISWEDREFGDPGEITLNFLNPGAVQAAFDAMLAGREVAQRTAADAATAELLGVEPDELADVALPFTVRNTATGQPVTIAMLKENKLATQLMGSIPDTMSLEIPEGVWVPGEPLIFIESFDRPQTQRVGNRTVYVVENGQIVRTSSPTTTWTDVYIGCTTPRAAPDRTCNPVRGRGATGYLRVFPGHTQVVTYHQPVSAFRSFTVDITPDVVGERVTDITEGDLERVRVVPNPYVIMSTYEQAPNTRRVLFTHLPPEGNIRIFTATGQFVQEMTWGPENLGSNGDLFWNLRTREDNEVASGLYVYTVTATGPAGKGRQALGKFVIIR